MKMITTLGFGVARAKQVAPSKQSKKSNFMAETDQ
jgi:hypothetical protein